VNKCTFKHLIFSQKVWSINKFGLSADFFIVVHLIVSS